MIQPELKEPYPKLNNYVHELVHFYCLIIAKFLNYAMFNYSQRFAHIPCRFYLSDVEFTLEKYRIIGKLLSITDILQQSYAFDEIIEQ